MGDPTPCDPTACTNCNLFPFGFPPAPTTPTLIDYLCVPSLCNIIRSIGEALKPIDQTGSNIRTAVAQVEINTTDAIVSFIDVLSLFIFLPLSIVITVLIFFIFANSEMRTGVVVLALAVSFVVIWILADIFRAVAALFIGNSIKNIIADVATFVTTEEKQIKGAIKGTTDILKCVVSSTFPTPGGGGIRKDFDEFCSLFGPTCVPPATSNTTGAFPPVGNVIGAVGSTLNDAIAGAVGETAAGTRPPVTLTAVPSTCPLKKRVIVYPANSSSFAM